MGHLISYENRHIPLSEVPPDYSETYKKGYTAFTLVKYQKKGDADKTHFILAKLTDDEGFLKVTPLVDPMGNGTPLSDEDYRSVNYRLFRWA